MPALVLHCSKPVMPLTWQTVCAGHLLAVVPVQAVCPARGCMSPLYPVLFPVAGRDSDLRDGRTRWVKRRLINIFIMLHGCINEERAGRNYPVRYLSNPFTTGCQFRW
ncbi:MAG: hypothetical protein WBQ78_09170 [Gammaproteobacteria bacterium]